MKRISLFAAAALAASLLAGCGSKPFEMEELHYRVEKGLVTAFPTEDQSMVLHNPDMGWVLYDNYIISKMESPAYLSSPMYDYDFPGVDTVMLKFTWADIEKSMDNYDFSEFDFIYDYWRDRGKTVTLGMSADSLLWYGSSGTGTPSYVLDALPQDKVQTREYIDNHSLKYRMCDANEPYYQERLRLFLEACDRHFKESGRPIDYIDLRGYGLWGEWHQGYQYESLEAKRSALDGIMKAWSEAFPDAWLALSYSYDPDEPYANYSDPNKYKDYLYWSAFDLAMNYPNITLRRDGAGGAIQNNERIFCQEVFEKLERGPFTSEGAGGYTGRSSAENILYDGLTLHPNYFTIIGWANQQARDFIELEPDLFAEGLNRMGYRLVLFQIQYPRSVGRKGDFIVKSQWVNRAAGRAVRDYELRAVLTDQDGEKQYEFALGDTGCSRWVCGEEGDQKYDLEMAVKLPDEVKKGQYVLHIAMYDAKTQRYIGLPLYHQNGENLWYQIGPLTVS